MLPVVMRHVVAVIAVLLSLQLLLQFTVDLALDTAAVLLKTTVIILSASFLRLSHSCRLYWLASR